MGFFRGLGKVAGALVDVRVDRWVSFSYVRKSFSGIKDATSGLFTIKQATKPETFEEALLRLKLTETDIAERQKEFLRLALLFSVLSFGLLLYALYWAMHLAISATLISFCLCAFCLSQGFRFHFWHFQVKHRKLGCTVEEWFNSRITEPPPQ